MGNSVARGLLYGLSSSLEENPTETPDRLWQKARCAKGPAGKAGAAFGQVAASCTVDLPENASGSFLWRTHVWATPAGFAEGEIDADMCTAEVDPTTCLRLWLANATAHDILVFNMGLYMGWLPPTRIANMSMVGQLHGERGPIDAGAAAFIANASWPWCAENAQALAAALPGLSKIPLANTFYVTPNMWRVVPQSATESIEVGFSKNTLVGFGNAAAAPVFRGAGIRVIDSRVMMAGGVTQTLYEDDIHPGPLLVRAVWHALLSDLCP